MYISNVHFNHPLVFMFVFVLFFVFFVFFIFSVVLISLLIFQGVGFGRVSAACFVILVFTTFFCIFSSTLDLA